MSDAQDSRVGSMFGPYHLKRLLGRGGMGEVYEAEHTVKEWTVAVKLMTAEFSKDPVFRERMKREARIAGRLQEPHVVPIHDYGEVDGQMFLEMRLVEGTDLDSVLKRFGPLTPPRAVAIITQIASALDAAHADGVMHRDVKPQNILITRDDFAYLVDFGIASATTDEKLTQLGNRGGHLEIHGPRTVLQRRGNLPRRHLRAGLRAARMLDRGPAVSRRQRRHTGQLPPDGTHPPAQRHPPGHPQSL